MAALLLSRFERSADIRIQFETLLQVCYQECPPGGTEESFGAGQSPMFPPGCPGPAAD
jgi:hypothetical protein